MGTAMNGFREDEVVVLSHWDKRESRWIETVYPKVGGRLRLAHEENAELSVTTEIVRYDEQVAVVKAVAATRKGVFSGMGMASVERDQKIAPAILELAETRAIARSLRFAGYGVEFCGAEEISHLSGNQGRDDNPEKPTETAQPTGGQEPPAPSNGNGNGNGGNSGRITNKQLNFIVNLGKDLGMHSKELDEAALSLYGVRMAHLRVLEASGFIDHLQGMRNAA